MQQTTTSDFAAQERELERQEIKKYGRMFIWEGYSHPAKQEVWIQASEKLRHINAHVVQDIEDYIMLEAFKGKSAADVRRIIDNDLANRKKKKGKSKDEEEEEKLEDKKRRFL